VLFAWHPGSMGGPAITDVLLGHRSPSGKLPVTFPKTSGQIPIYYAHKRTGRPPTPETVVGMQEIEPRAPQTSVGNTSFYLDAGDRPLFPFGFGLSYSEVVYSDLTLSADSVGLGESILVSAAVRNAGDVAVEEVVQCYVQDVVGSVTRPVRELKGFQRVALAPGEAQRVRFELHTDDLAFWNRQMAFVTEPGEFRVWIGGSSEATLGGRFEVSR
jgi:beta-glucosidase